MLVDYRPGKLSPAAPIYYTVFDYLITSGK